MKHSKKYLTICSLIVIYLFSTITSAANEGSLAADRETARLTAKLLIGELKKQFIKTPIANGIIRAELSKNKEKYHSSSESKGLIKMFVQAELEKKYKKDIGDILNSLNNNVRDGQKSWFTEQDEKELSKFPQKEVLNSLDKSFSKIYTRERRKACNDQWKHLTMDVYPTEEEFMSMDSRDLYDLLLRRVLTKQKEILFEESERYLKTEFIRPIIDDAQAQLNQQIKIISGSKGGKAKLPADIEAEVKKELEKARNILRRNKANKKVANKVYAVFKMVADKVSYRAKDIAATKFINYMDEITFPINTALIKRMIDGDITSHISRDESLAICAAKYKDEIITKTLSCYLNDVADSEGKFKKFLLRQLVDGQQMSESASQLVKRSVGKGFSEARALVAKGQMNDFFSPLQSGSWSLPYTLIEREFFKIGPISLDDPLSMKGISTSIFNKQLLIDETIKAVINSIQMIATEGRRAMKAQYGLVDTIERQAFVELDKLEKKDTSSVARTMLTFFKEESDNVSFDDVSDTQKIIAFYKRRTHNMWKAGSVDMIWPDKKQLPDNYTKKYLSLFGAIEADITRRVKSIMHNEDDYLSERRKHDPAKFTKLNLEAGGGSSRKKSGKSSGSGAGIGTGVGDIESDVLIDVKYEGDNIEISVDFVNRKYPVKVVLARDNYDRELDPLVNAFNEWIHKNAYNNEKVRMDVVMRIFNNDIHYGLVAEIRRRLKHQIAKQHSQKINIQWTDMLYSGE